MALIKWQTGNPFQVKNESRVEYYGIVVDPKKNTCILLPHEAARGMVVVSPVQEGTIPPAAIPSNIQSLPETVQVARQVVLAVIKMSKE